MVLFENVKTLLVVFGDWPEAEGEWFEGFEEFLVEGLFHKKSTMNDIIVLAENLGPILINILTNKLHI